MNILPHECKRIGSRRFVYFLFVLLLPLASRSVEAHSPHDNVTLVSLSPRYETDKTVFCCLRDRTNHFLKSTDKGVTWFPSQLGLTPNIIRSIAVSPSYDADQTIFAGSDETGVYKTTDGSLNWFPRNNGLTDLNVSFVALSPDFPQDQTVFVGTHYGSVFRSHDGGDSWESCMAGLDPAIVTAIAFSPSFTQDRVLYAATEGTGVFVSRDGGDTCQPSNNGLTDLNVTSMAISPGFASDGILFLGTSGSSLFKSLDGGATWSPSGAGITDPLVTGVAVSPDYGADLTVFCISAGKGVFKSTDGGSSWLLHENGLEQLFPQTSEHFQDIAVSRGYASDKTVFIAMFDGIFRTTNGGNEWTQLESYPQSLVRDLAVSPGYSVDGTLFAITMGGGVYRSTDYGATWAVKNKGLSFRFLSPIVVSPNFANDHTIWAGAIDHVNGSINSADNWIPIKGDLNGNYFLARSMDVSPDFVNDRTLFVGNSSNVSPSTYSVYKSTNGGRSYYPVAKLPASQVRLTAVSPDYANDRTVFVGTELGMFQSLDAGQTWTAMSMDKNLEDFAVSPSFALDSTLYVAERWGGIFKSVDRGLTWNAVDINAINDLSVTYVLLSPDYYNDQTVFASTVANGVFKSTDGGSSWISMGLEGTYVRPLRVSPDYKNDGEVYVGAWDGVYKYGGGTAWNRVLDLRRYEDTCANVKVDDVAHWGRYEARNASERMLTYTNRKGSLITFSFVGKSVAWIGTRNRNQGIAAVYLDGRLEGLVDQYAPQARFEQVLFKRENLSNSLHSLIIVVTGQKNANSTDAMVSIDAFDVYAH